MCIAVLRFEEQKSLKLCRMTKSCHTVKRLRHPSETRELLLYIDITWLAAKAPAIGAKGAPPFPRGNSDPYRAVFVLNLFCRGVQEGCTTDEL